MKNIGHVLGGVIMGEFWTMISREELMIFVVSHILNFMTHVTRFRTLHSIFSSCLHAAWLYWDEYGRIINRD
jgi:hypothetical protein